MWKWLDIIPTECDLRKGNICPPPPPPKNENITGRADDLSVEVCYGKICHQSLKKVSL